MFWSFSNTLAFTVAMTVYDMEEEKKRQRENRINFYKECCIEIADDSVAIGEIVENLVNKIGTVYVPEDMTTGLKYMPLYVFEKVIQEQRRVNDEQMKMLELYFNNVYCPFTCNQFVNMAIDGGEIEDYKYVIELKRNDIGSFWKYLFWAMYKSGSNKELQEIVDKMYSIIMRFSILGDPNSSKGLDVAKRFQLAINNIADECRTFDFEMIDWFGYVPVSVHIESLKETFESLVDNSHVTEDISKEELMDLLDMLIMHCICDLIFLTEKGFSDKEEMLNYIFDELKIVPPMDPLEYVLEQGRESEIGEFYRSMFKADPPLGNFWGMMAIMNAENGNIDGVISIATDILAIMIQAENCLHKKYNLYETPEIAKRYIMIVVSQLRDMTN